MTNAKSTKRALLTSVMALILCFTMLLGTTFAWFTDSVTSSNNVIQSGELKVGFQWADGTENPTTATWADASEGAIFNYDKWEPGYAVARHLKVSNEGTLALNYQMRIVTDGVVSELADVIDVYYFAEETALDRDDITDAAYLGTLTEVLGTQKNLSTKVNGSLEAGDPAHIHTIVLKMNENAGNEYQGLSLADFSIELIATQRASESDSFGSDYDKSAPNPAIPAALVTALESLAFDTTGSKMGFDLATNYGVTTLDVGYKFEPTMSYKDAQNSVARYWHADFVVSADKDIPALDVALAGYYDAWCSLNNDKWVALASDEVITAGTEIRLVESMGGGDITVNWEDLCYWGNDGIGFQCGAVALDPAVAGTTLTVELRIYETYTEEEALEKFGVKSTNYETGDYITVGTFTYTFPAYSVADDAALDEALANGVSNIELAAGTYNLTNNNLKGQTLTISGNEDTVIDFSTLSVNNQFVTDANLVFDGVTINYGTANYLGAANATNLTYKNCVINGYQYLYGDNVTFENCVLNSTGYSVCVYDASNVTFKNCEFNTAGKALLLYKDDLVNEVYNVTVENCVFNATQGATASAITNQNCAAIEIHNFGASYNLVTSGNTIDDDFSGEWRIKTFESSKGTTVTVNGTAYTQTALDGTLLTVVNKEVQ